MANPRVFISSTCYDLSEVRDSLVEFIRSFGFEPVLSDRGDVFYHPDIHTHDSCLNEVGNCQLLILLIGGRFGGSYRADPNKSIVNAEYAAARDRKIPVFTFVKRSVHSDHSVYGKNKNNKALSEIVFPSIDNNKNAKQIFEFIDEVRHAKVNNGFFPFDFAREIADLLRKQWSGMFFEFLQQRSVAEQMQTTTNLLKSISTAGEKVEELVKRLYQHVDSDGAAQSIADVEQKAITRQFFEQCFQITKFASFGNPNRVNLSIRPADFKTWYEYFAAATGGKISYLEEIEEEPGEFIFSWSNRGIVINPESASNIEWYSFHQSLFERLKGFNQKIIIEVVSELHNQPNIEIDEADRLG